MKLRDVIQNEGATVDAKGNVPGHTNGYYISAPDREETFPLWIINPDLFVEDFISRLYPPDDNYQYPDKYCYIGFWVYDDKLYCDMSAHIETWEGAISLAVKNKQLSFWDIARQCVVILDRDIPRFT